MKKIIIAGLVVILIIIGLIVSQNISITEEKVENTNINEIVPQEEIAKNQERMTLLTLYFYDTEANKIIPEVRNIDAKELLNDPYMKIMELLIEGSENSKIGKTIPEGTKLNSISINKNELTIDLNETFLSKYEKGSEGQLKMIYTIVDTFLELKEITGVKFLVNGENIEGISDSFVKLGE